MAYCQLTFARAATFHFPLSTTRSFCHIDVIVQINARAHMIWNDLETVADSNAGITCTIRCPLFFREFLEF